MGKYKVDNGTITKWVHIEEDEKRAGMLICRHYDENDGLLGTSWGKKNQDEIRKYMENEAA